MAYVTQKELCEQERGPIKVHYISGRQVVSDVAAAADTAGAAAAV